MIVMALLNPIGLVLYTLQLEVLLLKVLRRVALLLSVWKLLLLESFALRELLYLTALRAVADDHWLSSFLELLCLSELFCCLSDLFC